MSEEILELSNCPKCHGSHNYKLNVERALVICWMTAEMALKPPRKVRVTRLFSCPVKNEDFKADIILMESDQNKIEGVTVLGVINA